MRHAMIAFFFMISTVTTAALAQDGGASGPPKKAISLPQLTAPTPGSVHKFFQPAAELASMTK
ncbi:MAG: hypothetical protein JO184_13270 [Gammaproteobacteria bacterium]|nr:hypothetical protein [Gammaproteobacteria bacterium]